MRAVLEDALEHSELKALKKRGGAGTDEAMKHSRDAAVSDKALEIAQRMFSELMTSSAYERFVKKKQQTSEMARKEVEYLSEVLGTCLHMSKGCLRHYLQHYLQHCPASD